MKSLQQLFVEFYIGAVEENEIVAWACETISSNSQWANDKLIIEIAGLRPEISNDRKEVEQLFNKFFALQFPSFQTKTVENENLAKRALKQRCVDLLAGRVNAGKICRMVSPIETAFDYPKWLGNLYNVCDGTSDLETQKSAPYLTKEAKIICDKL
jgi:hypothetical protein